MKRILLITNTFPYGGETFLETEMAFLPEGIEADVWPFFIDRAKSNTAGHFSGVRPHVYDEPAFFIRARCLIRALRAFLAEKEYGAACSKEHCFRNTLKALKFAYTAEIRLAAIQKWLRGEKLRGMLIYAYWMYEAAYIGARLKVEYPDCGFVTRCHGYDLYEERHSNGYLPFRDFIMKSADRICPVSEHGRSYLLRRYGDVVKGKIQVARLGTIRKAAVPEAREKEDAVVLVSCSNLVDVKRVHRILDALRSARWNVHWYHFGDGSLRQQLEAQAESLPDNAACSFMGHQANDVVQRFYAEHAVSAFINVSQSEGVPVSIMEAESYAIPIIATDVGGTSEIVHSGENGVLLDVDFTDTDLLDAIDDVIAHREQYGSNALSVWERMSSAEAAFRAFYERLAELG